MQYTCKHFKISELVCPHVYKSFGDKSWEFLNPLALMFLDYFKEYLQRQNINGSVIVNDYNFSEPGNLTQRGLRCNLCQLVQDKTSDLVPYLSQHVLGNAFDLSVNGLTTDATREHLKKCLDEFNGNYLVMLKKRWKGASGFNIHITAWIEKNTNGWVHVDFRQSNKTGSYYLFKA